MKSDLFKKSTISKEKKRKNMLYFESLKKDVIKRVEDKKDDSLLDDRKNFENKKKPKI